MIYQTLITACWKPHLLSWCMVMIAPRHCLPWILTNALLSSLLVSSLHSGSIFLSQRAHISTALSSLQRLYFFVFVALNVLPFCACLSAFSFLISFLCLWLLLEVLSHFINASFNPPVIPRSRSSSVPSHSTCLSCFEMKRLDAGWDNAGMQPDTKYHCHGPVLNLIWMPRMSWHEHIRLHSHWKNVNRHFTPTADHQISAI